MLSRNGFSNFIQLSSQTLIARFSSKYRSRAVWSVVLLVVSWRGVGSNPAGDKYFHFEFFAPSAPFRTGKWMPCNWNQAGPFTCSHSCFRPQIRLDRYIDRYKFICKWLYNLAAVNHTYKASYVNSRSIALSFAKHYKKHLKAQKTKVHVNSIAVAVYCIFSPFEISDTYHSPMFESIGLVTYLPCFLNIVFFLSAPLLAVSIAGA